MLGVLLSYSYNTCRGFYDAQQVFVTLIPSNLVFGNNFNLTQRIWKLVFHNLSGSQTQHHNLLRLYIQLLYRNSTDILPIVHTMKNTRIQLRQRRKMNARACLSNRVEERSKIETGLIYCTQRSVCAEDVASPLRLMRAITIKLEFRRSG